MKAKLAGALAVTALRHVIATCSKQTSHGTVENGERHIREYKTLISIVLNGDYLKRNAAACAAMSAMRNAALNIHHGNRAPIVVRGRESRPQGEGEQFVFQYRMKKGV